MFSLYSYWVGHLFSKKNKKSKQKIKEEEEEEKRTDIDLKKEKKLVQYFLVNLRL